MNIVTTIQDILPELFIIILMLVGLRLAYSGLFRPHLLLRMKICFRGYASKLWFEAYHSEDREVSKGLFSISERFEKYADLIEEDRLILKDMDFCGREINVLNKDRSQLNSCSNAQKRITNEKIILVLMILYVLSIRYPLTIGLILLNVTIFMFIIEQWRNFRQALSEIQLGSLAPQKA